MRRDAVTRPPIVDDRYTRRLETRDIERSNVKSCEIALATPAARFEIGLRPFTLRARDGAGRVVAEVGGPEKNRFHAWDTYNTGICRTRERRPLAVECFALHPQEAGGSLRDAARK